MPQQPVDSPLDPELLDGLWDFDDPAGSEQRFRQAIGAAVADSSGRAELTTQLARLPGPAGPV